MHNFSRFSAQKLEVHIMQKNFIFSVHIPHLFQHGMTDSKLYL